MEIGEEHVDGDEDITKLYVQEEGGGGGKRERDGEGWLLERL